MIDLLIKNVSILTMDRKRTFLRQGCVVVDRGRIVALGASLGYPARETIDGAGKLASGVAPISELLKMGVRLGLGTDSNLSNNNLDMFEEMRMGTLLHYQEITEKNGHYLSS